MTKLSIPEQRVLDTLKAAGAPLSPTKLGMIMGHKQTRASSRVAAPLRLLTAAGYLEKIGERKDTVYKLTSKGSRTAKSVTQA